MSEPTIPPPSAEDLAIDLALLISRMFRAAGFEKLTEIQLSAAIRSRTTEREASL